MCLTCAASGMKRGDPQAFDVRALTRLGRSCRISNQERSVGFTVTEDLPVVGLADRLAELGDEDREGAATRLREYADSTGVPGPAPRGALSDAYGQLVDRLRGRRVIEDLGEHPAAFAWLELHVPPGGSGQLGLQNEQGSDSGVALSIVGLNYGNGRVAKLSVSEDFGERQKCLQLVQHVSVRVVRHADGPPRGDVTRVRHVEVVPWLECPRCGQSPSELDTVSYELAGTGLDLSHDEAGAERTMVHELSGSGERGLGVSIPLPADVPALTVSFKATTTFSLVCNARYHFAAGRHYTPVRPVDDGPALPFWLLEPWP
jgi:hypothetical protein